jgi:hypothetical protein
MILVKEDHTQKLLQKKKDKNKRKMYNHLQKYLNNLVDKKVLEPRGAETISAKIYKTIFVLNAPIILEDYLKIMNNPNTPSTSQYENKLKKKSRLLTKEISTIETTRITENLKYVDNLLLTKELDLKKYEDLISKSLTGSRYEILSKCLLGGSMLTGLGLSYGELNTLASNLELFKDRAIELQEALDINQEAITHGLAAPIADKMWIWSGSNNTRHSEMDGVTVGIDENFTVTNEQTGEVDSLRFPGDVSADNPSNIVNCQCSMEYIPTKEGGVIDG